MHFHDTNKCFNTQMCMLQSSNFIRPDTELSTFTTLRSNQINSRDTAFKEEEKKVIVALTACTSHSPTISNTKN